MEFDPYSQIPTPIRLPAPSYFPGPQTWRNGQSNLEEIEEAASIILSFKNGNWDKTQETPDFSNNNIQRTPNTSTDNIQGTSNTSADNIIQPHHGQIGLLTSITRNITRAFRESADSG